MDFSCNDVAQWKDALDNYQQRLEEVKPGFYDAHDSFYLNEMPDTLRQRQPNPFLTKDELIRIYEWSKFRSHVTNTLRVAIQSLGEEEVKLATQRAFEALPTNLENAMKCLTEHLNGIGVVFASALLSVHAPERAPFMSQKVRKAVLSYVHGTLKDYTTFVEKLLEKAQVLNDEGENFTISDLERALWISAEWSNLQKRLARIEAQASSNMMLPPEGIGMDFSCIDVARWKDAHENYQQRLEVVNPGFFGAHDSFYLKEMPDNLRQRQPNPFLTKDELRRIYEWTKGRGEMSYTLDAAVQSLGEEEVKLATQRAFEALPNNLEKAVGCLKDSLNGIDVVCSTAILAVHAPELAAFMSQKALKAVLGIGHGTLQDYSNFVAKLQEKAEELNGNGGIFTISDLERALWISALWSECEAQKISYKNYKRKR